MTLSRLGFACMVAGLSLLGACENNPDYLRLHAYNALYQGDYDHSQKLFDRTIANAPEDYKSHYYLGLIALQHNNDAASAVRELELAYTVLKSRPDLQLGVKPDTYQTAVPAPTLSQVCDALAEAYFRQQNSARLAGFLKEMTHDRGDLDDYIRFGKYMYKVGDPDSARQGFVLALRLAPSGNPEPYLAIADFYDAVGDRPQAMTYLRQAYYVKPGDPDVVSRIRAHGEVPGPSIALPPEKNTNEPTPALEQPAPRTPQSAPAPAPAAPAPAPEK